MNEKAARKIFKENGYTIKGSNFSNDDVFVSFIEDDPFVRLSGDFSADELEAIAWWMRNKND